MSKNAEKVKGIKATTQHEGQKKMWYFISRSQKDPHSAAPYVVQRMVDGIIQESAKITQKYLYSKKTGIDANTPTMPNLKNEAN